MTTKTKKQLVTPTEEIQTRLNNDVWSNWCVPTNLTPLKPYALVIVHSRNHRRGNHWEAKLYKDGKPIIFVENEGNGGCNRYYGLKKDEFYSPFEKEFEKAAKLAYPDEKYASSAKDMAVAFLDLVSLCHKEEAQ